MKREKIEMKKVIKTIHELNASADDIWEHIKKGDGLERWLPIIISCSLDGTGEGAKRTCKTAQGTMNETILRIDQNERLFQYAIDEQPLLPIENVVGTIQVKPHNENAQLLWDVAFKIKDESLMPMVQKAIEELYTAGAEGLEKLTKT